MEIWRRVPIPEYEEMYMISNLGQVYSVKSGRCLKPKRTRVGYYRIALAHNGKIKNVAIHRLVAMAFIPNPENKPTVNHKNENKTDNRVENLEWMTNAEQNVYGTRIERVKAHTDYKNRGIDYMQVAAKHDYSRQNMCHRRMVDVWTIHGTYLGRFKSQKAAAVFTGVSQGKVSQCVLGQKTSCKGYVFKTV